MLIQTSDLVYLNERLTPGQLKKENSDKNYQSHHHHKTVSSSVKTI